ncbi:MAG: enhanced serine sensitivity protein SseB C-terminal domain-containing protein [Sphingomicrobium sp.]
MKTLKERDIEFMAGQDGPAETRLKKALSSLFSSETLICSAYLCMVSYNGCRNAVALCLDSRGDIGEIVRTVEKIFSDQFNASESLDIIRLSAEQRRQINQVCPPFYTAVIQ